MTERGRTVAIDAFGQLIKRQQRRKAVRRALLAVVVLLVVAIFIVGTPFALSALGSLKHADWAQFSNEGQTYGGIAAVFGILALAGIAATVILQSRQTAITHAIAQRTVHADLFSKALNDPELLARWGPSIYGDLKQDRQHAYLNLIVSFWRSEFELGTLSEEELRGGVAYMFAAAPGRRYWSIAGPNQRTFYDNDRDRKFTSIIDEEYNNVVGVPIVELPDDNARPTPKRDRSTLGILALGFAGGVLLSGAPARIRRVYKTLS